MSDSRIPKDELKRRQAEFHAELKSAPSPAYVERTHEEIVESRLTTIAWFTGIVAVGVVVSAIGSLILVAQLG